MSFGKLSWILNSLLTSRIRINFVFRVVWGREGDLLLVLGIVVIVADTRNKRRAGQVSANRKGALTEGGRLLQTTIHPHTIRHLSRDRLERQNEASKGGGATQKQPAYNSKSIDCSLQTTLFQLFFNIVCSFSP